MTSRERVIELANDGLPVSKIMTMTGLSCATVLGYVKTARAFGVSVRTPTNDLLERLVSQQELTDVANRVTQIIGLLWRTDVAASLSMGVPEVTVRAWRTQVALPNVRGLMAICRAAGVSPNWLLFGRSDVAKGKEAENAACKKGAVHVA